jgi:hypothetical protein
MLDLFGTLTFMTKYVQTGTGWGTAGQWHWPLLCCPSRLWKKVVFDANMNL